MLTKSLKDKDFISLMDYSIEELETVLGVDNGFKKKNSSRRTTRVLKK